MPIQDIYAVVTSTAAELSVMLKADIRPEHTLFGDLAIDGDDFSFEFVPALEKALEIKTRQSDWDTVRTVRDAVAMLQKMVAGQTSTSGH